MHLTYQMHTNWKTDSVVPQFKPRPAGPIERRDICQQHAPFPKKSCSVSSAIQKAHTTHPLASKKQKAEKEKKQGENTGKKEDTPKQPKSSQERRTTSEEKQKRDLSNMRRNGSPSLLHNSCVQVRTMGNYLSGTHNDLDEESYDTPPETLDTDQTLNLTMMIQTLQNFLKMTSQRTRTLMSCKTDQRTTQQ